jgi:arabinosyltransferase
MAREWPPAEFGEPIEWREYSFLHNPRLPKAVRESQLEVEVCAAGAAGCADGSGPATEKGGVVRLKPGLNDQQIKAALAVSGAQAPRGGQTGWMMDTCTGVE